MGGALLQSLEELGEGPVTRGSNGVGTYPKGQQLDTRKFKPVRQSLTELRSSPEPGALEVRQPELGAQRPQQRILAERVECLFRKLAHPPSAATELVENGDAGSLDLLGLLVELVVRRL